MYKFEEIAERHIALANKIFPEATPLSCAIHCQKEAQEFLDAVQNKETDAAQSLEAADVVLTIITYYARKGVPIEDLLESMAMKVGINEKRDWKKNPDGTYSHVKK